MHYKRMRPCGTCVVPGCESPLHARGWCSAHYQSWRRYGDPLKARRTGVSPWGRLTLQVVGVGDCWIFIGNVNNRGYSRIRVGGRSGRDYLGHRVAYETMRGPIPPGWLIDHLCRNKACVNPQHLEPVTAKENSRRAVASLQFCLNGLHEWTPENTEFYGGRRWCKACRLASRQRRGAKSGGVRAGSHQQSAAAAGAPRPLPPSRGRGATTNSSETGTTPGAAFHNSGPGVA